MPSRDRRATDLGKRQAARAASERRRVDAAVVIQKNARGRLAKKKVGLQSDYSSSVSHDESIDQTIVVVCCTMKNTGQSQRCRVRSVRGECMGDGPGTKARHRVSLLYQSDGTTTLNPVPR